MNSELIGVIALLVVVMVLFATNKIRVDIVALLVIIVFVLSGVLTLQEALSGFSDPNVILISTLFIVGDGLVRTGIAYQVGDGLVKIAGSSEIRMMVFLMLAVAGLGSVMSSTGIVAIFIPIVLSVSARMKISPARLMMPLSFAGLISGMMTLVATPPNMVVNSELMRDGSAGFGFFSVTPIGLVILLMGIGYMLIARRWLSGKVDGGKTDMRARQTMRDLIREYGLKGRARRLSIRPGSPMIGHSLDDLHLRLRYGANVIGVERWRKFRRVFVQAFGNTELCARDVLLVDMPAGEGDVRQFCSQEMLEPMILRGEYFAEQAREIGMAEVSLTPESDLLGSTIRQLSFRSRYDLNVTGIRRKGQALTGKLVDEPLQLGDILLVVGEWKKIRKLPMIARDFLLLNLPVEVKEMAPARSQAPHALLCLLLMVVLMLIDGFPNVIAAIITCLLMAKFRCINMDSAYHSIHWPSLILIIGMLPFAQALQKTGGVDLVVSGLMELIGDKGPTVALLYLFIVCAVIGLFISNTATAVLMAPIAIATAKELQVSPYPFAMLVAIAASAAFMTPVSSPVNTLVLNPGGYTFGDFVRIGVPFTLLVMLVSIYLIPLLFPF